MVAVHSPGANIPAGTLRRIILDAGWTAEDLRRLRLVRWSAIGAAFGDGALGLVGRNLLGVPKVGEV